VLGGSIRRRRIRRLAGLLLALLVTCLLLDALVTAGLRRSDLPLFAEWNDIVSGDARSDLIILGSSRAWVQFSPDIIGAGSGMTCYNLGIDGYTLDMQLARYAIYGKYDGAPKVVALSLDTYSLNRRDDLYQNDQFLPYLEEAGIWGAVTDYGHFHWYDRHLPLVRYRGRFELICKGLAEVLHLRHYTSAKTRGYQGRELQWSKDFEEFVEEHPDGVDQKYQCAMVDELDRFLTDRRREGVEVVLVYPPEYYQAREMTNNREQIFTIFRSLAEKHGVTFLDYSYDPLCYDTAYFYNSQHLNKTGAELFSAEFARDLSAAVGSAVR